jgi:hypothetical protein
MKRLLLFYYLFLVFLSGGQVISAQITADCRDVTYHGYGNPISAKTKTLTINTNSAGIAKTCTATVSCIYATKNILVMGNSTALGSPTNGAYGYDANARAYYNDGTKWIRQSGLTECEIIKTFIGQKQT